MKTFLNNLLTINYYKKLESRTYKTFFITGNVCLFAAIAYFFYLLLHIYFKTDVRVLIFQADSVVVSIVAYFLNKKTFNKLAISLICTQLIISIFFWNNFLGVESGLYLFALVPLLPIFEFHNFSYSFKLIITFIFLILTLTSIYIADNVTSNVIISEVTQKKLSYVTFVCVFLMLVFEIYVNYLSNSLAYDTYSDSIKKAKDDSMTDSLTSLWNRRYLEVNKDDIMEVALNDSVCIAILDIDSFKVINDKYTHEVGDLVLKQLSALMRNSFRRSDVLIRWGGEEFIVILYNVQTKEGVKIMDDFRKLVSTSPVTIQEDIINFTFTCGIYEINNKNHICVDEAIAKADALLYAGKKSGKNKVVCVESGNYNG